MQDSIKLVLLDDHSMIRKGMRLTVETEFGINQISEVGGCAALLTHLRNNEATHLLLDLLVSDGNTLEIIPPIRKLYPKLRIMMFTMQPKEVYFMALKQYGIDHYLHKEAAEDIIVKSLKSFFENQQGYRDVLSPALSVYGYNPFSNLTARELEVIHYLLKGSGTKQISEILNIHMSTVSTLKARIFEKVDVSNLKELIDLALLYNISH